MAGYPHGSGYPPYGAPPPQPYGAPSAPYAQPGEKPPKEGKQGGYGSASAPPAGYGYGSDPYAHGGEKPPKEGKQSGYGSSSPAGYGYGSDPYAHGHGGEKPPKEGKQSGYGSAPPAGYGYGSDPYAHGHGGEKPPKEGKQSGYGYESAPPAGYGSAPPAGYGSAPPSSGYGSAPPPSGYGSAPPSGYGSAPPSGYGLAPPAYGNSPFAALMPSAFPPGTDPNVVACFQSSDTDGSGFIDDKELQRALSSYNQSFSLRTVHLMMYLFTNSNVRKIGPKEFTSVFYSLQNWRAIFEKSDHDRSGKIDINELREALFSLGFAVSPVVLDLLVSKFDKSGGKSKSIEYDHFIECCLTVKGLTEKFKEKDMTYSGSATFTYESFMLTVLPFLIA